MEDPIKMGWFGGILFLETPNWTELHAHRFRFHPLFFKSHEVALPREATQPRSFSQASSESQVSGEDIISDLYNDTANVHGNKPNLWAYESI